MTSSSVSHSKTQQQIWLRLFFLISFILLLGAYANIFAIGSPYQPGSTLDPACIPGETNCIVQIIPSQTSNTNKYLTTDGTSTSWSSSTLVLGGNFTTSGAYATTLTTTGTTTLTLPTTGTLATTSNINTAVSGTTNYIPKFTGTNTIGNSLIFDDGTNIGIGTQTPSSKLQVSGDIRITSGSGGALIFADGTSINTSSIPGSAGSLANTSDAIITGDSDANATGDVILKTASNDRLHILNTGNVGINTATPPALFSVGTSSPFQVTNLGVVTALSYTGAGTGLTGTASSLTAGNVTTNANLTGHITSTGNATSLGSFTSSNLLTALSDETGTGLAVFATSPTLTTPNIGVATGTSLDLSSGAITSGLINGQTISNSANFTGSVTGQAASFTTGAFSGAVTIGNDVLFGLTIGRYSAGIPISYIKASSSSTSGFRFQNHDGADAIIVDGSSNTTLSGSLTGTSATFNSAKLKLGADGTYGSTYSTISFGGTSVNGDNRIFAGNDNGDHLYIAAGTGKTVKIWANGSSADIATFASSAITLNQALTGTSATFSGQVAIGTTSSNWDSTVFKGLQIGTSNAFIVGRVDSATNQVMIGTNSYYKADGNWSYLATAPTSRYYQTDGAHIFERAVSGTSGSNVTWLNSMTLGTTGSATFAGSITATGANSNTFGNASLTGRSLIIQAGSTNQAIQLKNAAGGDGTISATGTSTTLNYSFNTYSTADALYIQNNGNVGIGTASPVSNIGWVGLVDNKAGVSSGYILHNTGSAQEGVTALSGGLYFDVAGHVTAANNIIVFRTEETTSQFTPTERMRIDSNGNVGINTSPSGTLYVKGVNTSYTFAIETNINSNIALAIGGSGNINGVSAGKGNAAATILQVARDTGTLRSINAEGSINASGADYAEYFYQEYPGTLQAGETVCLAMTTGKVKKCDTGDTIIGVVSTFAGFIGNDLFDPAHPENTALVALTGQVPLKVSTENGPIAIGDHLTKSSTTGIAMKATTASQSFGIALSGTTADGMVLIFLKEDKYISDSQLQMIQEMDIKVEAIPTLADQTLYSKISDFLRGIAEQGTAVVDNITAKFITADSVISKNVETDKVQSNQFCAGSTCMDEAQLKEVLDYISSHRTVTPPPSDPTPSLAPTPDPAPPTEPVPSPTDEVTPPEEGV